MKPVRNFTFRIDLLSLTLIVYAVFVYTPRCAPHRQPAKPIPVSLRVNAAYDD